MGARIVEVEKGANIFHVWQAMVVAATFVTYIPRYNNPPNWKCLGFAMSIFTVVVVSFIIGGLAILNLRKTLDDRKLSHAHIDSTPSDIIDKFYYASFLSWLLPAALQVLVGWSGYYTGLAICVAGLTIVVEYYERHVENRIKKAQSSQSSSQAQEQSNLVKQPKEPIFERYLAHFALATHLAIGASLMYRFSEAYGTTNSSWVRLVVAFSALVRLGASFAIAWYQTELSEDKLQIAKVSKSKLEASRRSVFVTYSVIALTVFVLAVCMTIFTGFWGFHASLILGWAALTGAMTFHGELIDALIRETGISAKSKKARMDEKDRKIIKLQETIEGLQHLKATSEQEAKEAKGYEEVVRKYEGMILDLKISSAQALKDAVDSVRAERSNELKAASGEHTTADAEYAETIQRYEDSLQSVRAACAEHRDHIEALQKRLASREAQHHDIVETLRGSLLDAYLKRAEVKRYAKELADSVSQMVTEEYHQKILEQAKADAAIEARNAMHEDSKRQLETVIEPYEQFIANKAKEYEAAIKQKDEHSRALLGKQEELIATVAEKTRLYKTAVATQDKKQARALEAQKEKLDTRWYKRLVEELAVQEKRLTSEKTQAEAKASNQAVARCTAWFDKTRKITEEQHSKTLLERQQEHSDQLKKLHQAYDTQIEIIKGHHQDEMMVKDKALQKITDQRTRDVEVLGLQLWEQIQLLATERQKSDTYYMYYEQWCKKVAEEVAEKDAVAAAAEEGAVFVPYENHADEAADEESDSDSIDSLPELIEDEGDDYESDEECDCDEDECLAGCDCNEEFGSNIRGPFDHALSEMAEAAIDASGNEDLEDEWNESDVEIIVDAEGSENDGIRDNWSYVESDDEQELWPSSFDGHA